MSGLVIVSHSQRLAEGVAELVEQVAGSAVPVAVAGGLDGGVLGTAPERVITAIREVAGDDGVLVLMDLGSALLSAEMALELLTPAERERVRLVAAPLVEGAVAAAAVLAAGGDLEAAAREAAGALEPKRRHLAAPASRERQAGAPLDEAELARLEVVLSNPAGLHARPAAQMVRAAARFNATVWARNARTPHRRASLASINELALLDARQHDTLILEASGPERHHALRALAELVRSGFGEAEDLPQGDPAGRRTGVTTYEAPAGRHKTPHNLPGVPGTAEPPPVPERGPEPGRVLEGVAVTPGVGWGRTYRVKRFEGAGHQEPAQTPAEEWVALEAALTRVAQELEALRAEAPTPEAAAIFEAQALFLRDPLLLESARQAVDAGQPARRAWLAACQATAAAYRALANPLLRQRAADVEDIGQRVARLLAGAAEDPWDGVPLGPSTLLVVDELFPSDVARLRGRSLAAICSARGDRLAHAAILARSLPVPVIVGLGEELLRVPDGTEGVADGISGRFYVAPDPATLARLQARGSHWQALEQRALSKLASPPPCAGGAGSWWRPTWAHRLRPGRRPGEARKGSGSFGPRPSFWTGLSLLIPCCRRNCTGRWLGRWHRTRWFCGPSMWAATSRCRTPRSRRRPIPFWVCGAFA